MITLQTKLVYDFTHRVSEDDKRRLVGHYESLFKGISLNDVTLTLVTSPDGPWFKITFYVPILDKTSRLELHWKDPLPVEFQYADKKIYITSEGYQNLSHAIGEYTGKPYHDSVIAPLLAWIFNDGENVKLSLCESVSLVKTISEMVDRILQ